MRSFLICLLLAVSASAVPLEFTPQTNKAHGYTLTVSGDWTPMINNTTCKKDERYGSGPTYPQVLGGVAVYEKNAGDIVNNLKMMEKIKGTNEFEEVKLGSIPALLDRGKTEFHIYAGVGTTKIVIGYTDGRDSLERTPYDDILAEVLQSFKLSPAK